MNEHQLLIWKCIDSAKVYTMPDSNKRIMYSVELSRIALESCKTAREAIKLMGELIRDYGHYGTGETLLVGDTRESWAIEICSYDKDGTDGVWVAKRVPDDEIFAATNKFRVREVLKDNPNMTYLSIYLRFLRKTGGSRKTANWILQRYMVMASFIINITQREGYGVLKVFFALS